MNGNEILTESPVDEAEVTDFAALGLGPETLRAVADLGFETPTPIQEQTIRLLLEGRDVIADAPTGTGKTAAYGLPIIERIDADDLSPQALVVAPTRELAIQVAEALHAMGKYHETVTLPIYGGQPYDRQLRALHRGVQLVVGTPGRLLDHVRQGTLRLGGVRTVVLDEADEMLNMGFIEDIEAILAELPEERQSVLFSATIPPRIAGLAERFMRNPARVSVETQQALAPRVRQVYYDVPARAKPEALARILDLEQPESGIVFVRTRRDADAVAEKLNGLGYVAQAIHGDISQAQRERVLGRFRTGHTQLLVATDVAARGLDIPEVSHVINYDLPMDAEMYVHRIGRTGRAGRSGTALTLVMPHERRALKIIEHAVHRRIQRLQLPTPADVAARRRVEFQESVMRILDEGQLDPYLALVQDLAGRSDPAELAAAAFKMAAQARDAGRSDGKGSWLEPAADAVLDAPPPPPREETRFERDSRRPRQRPERDGRRAAAREEGMTRLFVRVGRDVGVRPADLVGAIANEAGVPGNAVGDIDIYDGFSFVEVPSEIADRVLHGLNGTTIRGKEPRAVVARPSDGYGDRGDDGRDRTRARRQPAAAARHYTPQRMGGRERAGRRPS